MIRSPKLIAKSIIDVTGRGERDPEQIKKRAIKALGIRETDPGIEPILR
jgi:hypothetical protein